MKVEQLERFACSGKTVSSFLLHLHPTSRSSSSSTNNSSSGGEGHPGGDDGDDVTDEDGAGGDIPAPALDALYIGCESGHISVFHLPHPGHSLKQVKEEVLSPEQPRLHHNARVTVMIHTSHYLHNGGLLVSGSLDRTVKVWSGKSMVQTLQHSASVSGLADASDGSVISISMDGILRVWAPQSNRQMMLNPFFECTFQTSVTSSQMTGEAWIAALELSTHGYWGAYVGESDGSISLYRKSVDNFSDFESRVASQALPLIRTKRWERLHKLGITKLKILPDESYLVSLASDGCCKVLDAIIGAVILSFDNPRKCIYTGLAWAAAESTLFLTDELGFLQAFNVGREKNIDSVQICVPSRKQQTKISTSHAEQCLGGISSYHTPRTFFTLSLPFSTKAIHATMATNQPTPGKPKAKDAEELASLGEVHFIKIVTNTSCVEFLGHEGAVLGVSINACWGLGSQSQAVNDSKTTEEAVVRASHSNPPTGAAAAAASLSTHSNAAAAARLQSTLQTLRVSKEEAAFFSVANDFTIRCWDEFDASESYQFKSKGNSAFISVKVIWNINSIATGHENGALRLWNSDAGSYVESRALKQSLTCIIEARNSRSHLLVGADFAGMIAVWNLTAFRQNPVMLPVESLFQSNHDLEDPGVLSLAFHKRSNTFFSGGVDRVVKVWRLDVEISGSLRSHNEPVCCLECTDNFLLSGDEGGEILLWRILSQESRRAVSATAAGSALPVVSAVCRFYCAASGPSRSIVAIQEINAGKVYVVQAGRGGTSCIWEVWLQQMRNSRNEAGVSVSSSISILLASADAAEAMTLADAANSSKADHVASDPDPVAQLHPHSGPFDHTAEGSLGRNKHQSVVVSRTSSLESERKPDEEFKILHDCNAEISISVSSFAVIGHDEHEATCAQLQCTDFGVPQHLYLGTIAGPILRYRIH